MVCCWFYWKFFFFCGVIQIEFDLQNGDSKFPLLYSVDKQENSIKNWLDDHGKGYHCASMCGETVEL